MLPSHGLQQHKISMVPQNMHPMITRSKSRVTKPKMPFATLVTDTTISSTVSEALANPSWHKAMQLEFEDLQNKKNLVLGTSNIFHACCRI